MPQRRGKSVASSRPFPFPLSTSPAHLACRPLPPPPPKPHPEHPAAASITVKQILIGIQELLDNPNNADPAQYQSSQDLKENKAVYDRKVGVESRAKREASLLIVRQLQLTQHTSTACRGGRLLRARATGQGAGGALQVDRGLRFKKGVSHFISHLSFLLPAQ